MSGATPPRSGLIDTISARQQDTSVKRLATFLLLIGAVIGIAVQPAQALAPALATVSMAQMSQATMATMPNCTASSPILGSTATWRAKSGASSPSRAR